jgi:DNA helicase HerA-like ATPase
MSLIFLRKSGLNNIWVSSIINLNKYDSNILESIRYNKNYSIKISLDAIYEIIPMSRKEVDKYNSLVNYLMTLGIDMTITSNHKNKGRKKKRN